MESFFYLIHSRYQLCIKFWIKAFIYRGEDEEDGLQEA
jgi:hypothetical protein